MIRARMSDGRFLFGIDAVNIFKLMDGQPIKVDLKEMGGSDSFVIVFGPTYADIIEDIAKAVGTTPEELLSHAQEIPKNSA